MVHIHVSKFWRGASSEEGREHLSWTYTSTLVLLWGLLCDHKTQSDIFSCQEKSKIIQRFFITFKFLAYFQLLHYICFFLACMYIYIYIYIIYWTLFSQRFAEKQINSCAHHKKGASWTSNTDSHLMWKTFRACPKCTIKHRSASNAKLLMPIAHIHAGLTHENTIYYKS